MPVRTPKETFLLLLSDVRQSTEKATQIYEEMGRVAQDPEIKEALEARAFVSEGILAKLDQCFKLIGEKPIKLTGHLRDTFIEDFRTELAEIESPLAKRLFVLAKLVHFVHLRIGEYVALIAAADIAGNQGVAVILESCLADKLAFLERTKRIIRRAVETRVAEKMAAERAA
jgi:ferritin-like metal-binding protein YciE